MVEEDELLLTEPLDQPLGDLLDKGFTFEDIFGKEDKCKLKSVSDIVTAS